MLVVYADDMAALIAGRDVELAQLKLNRVMCNVWMADHGLSLALNKTEIIVLTKKKDLCYPPHVSRRKMFETKLAAKYQGCLLYTSRCV